MPSRELFSLCFPMLIVVLCLEALRCFSPCVQQGHFKDRDVGLGSLGICSGQLTKVSCLLPWDHLPQQITNKFHLLSGLLLA